MGSVPRSLNAVFLWKAVDRASLQTSTILSISHFNTAFQSKPTSSNQPLSFLIQDQTFIYITPIRVHLHTGVLISP